MSLKARLSQPGFVLSGLVHAGALAATLIAFSSTEKFEDQQETVPVEVVTDNQFNQIMKGDKSADKVRPDAPAQTQAVASAAAETPEPPAPQQAPPPPAPSPPPAPQAEQKPPPDPVMPPPRPTPPPDPTPPVPTPPIRTVEVPDAEPIVPRPVPKPVVKPPPPVPTPPVVPHPVVRHDPPPPKPLPRPAEKPKLDQLAKLMEEVPDTPTPPTPKPAPPRPKPAPPAPPAAKPAPEAKEVNHFDLTDITKLLTGHDAPAPTPASTASSKAQLSRVASLGSPTASAPKMSPSFWAGLDGLMEDQYRSCWSYLGLTSGVKYVPQVRVIYGQDGALQGQPVLLNPPSDPALQSLADSAMRAVRRCNPLKIPEQYAPYYDQWKGRVLRFDPAEMAG